MAFHKASNGACRKREGRGGGGAHRGCTLRVHNEGVRVYGVENRAAVGSSSSIVSYLCPPKKRMG